MEAGAAPVKPKKEYCAVYAFTGECIKLQQGKCKRDHVENCDRPSECEDANCTKAHLILTELPVAIQNVIKNILKKRERDAGKEAAAAARDKAPSASAQAALQRMRERSY